MPDRRRSNANAITTDEIYDADTLETLRLFRAECVRQTGSKELTGGLIQFLQIAKGMYERTHPQPHPPITNYLISDKERAELIAQMEAEEERVKLSVL